MFTCQLWITTTTCFYLGYNVCMEIEQEKGELLKLLGDIKKQLIISNSLPRKFFSALLYGLGTVIGATILLTVVLYILTLLANYGVFTSFNNWLVSTLGR